MMRARDRITFAFAVAIIAASVAHADGVRVKDLGHFLGWRQNALVGYGIVTGLAGSGDSPRSTATRRALSNVLTRLGANIAPDELESRNVAAVIITANLPPSANVGDRIDVTVTSIGDARSLAGGTLLMTPLLAADQQPYALAQGALVVGGYSFQDTINLRQKNYPTTGIVADGATVEKAVSADLFRTRGHITFVLQNPDITTAQRISDSINLSLGHIARVESADAIAIDAMASSDFWRLIASVENVSVEPDQIARVIINERSGTVVAGGNVKLSSVSIAQGDIKVSVSVDDHPLAPYVYGIPDSRGVIVANRRMNVTDTANDAVVHVPDTTVADLVGALNRAHVGTRSTIAILQAIKAAGALHAEIVVE